jgi:hypothetical protein
LLPQFISNSGITIIVHNHGICAQSCEHEA